MAEAFAAGMFWFAVGLLTGIYLAMWYGPSGQEPDQSKKDKDSWRL